MKTVCRFCLTPLEDYEECDCDEAKIEELEQQVHWLKIAIEQERKLRRDLNRQLTAVQLGHDYAVKKLEKAEKERDNLLRILNGIKKLAERTQVVTGHILVEHIEKVTEQYK